MKIQEIMTPNPRFVTPDVSLTETAQVLRDLDVGAVPVCENERLVGILTDRDISIRATANGQDPNRTTVRETMSVGMSSVFEDQEIDEAARILEDEKIRRLPVLNQDRQLVGIVSLGDLAVESSPNRSGEALKEISEPAQPQR
jgi:CBS domain-containing protein